MPDLRDEPTETTAFMRPNLTSVSSPDLATSAAERRRRIDEQKRTPPSPSPPIPMLPAVPADGPAHDDASIATRRASVVEESRRHLVRAQRNSWLAEQRRFETYDPIKRTATPGEPSPEATWKIRKVLALSGYEDGVHRYGVEISRIRDAFGLSRSSPWRSAEKVNATLLEIIHQIEDEQPEILHITAHADELGVHFARSRVDKPQPVDPQQIVATIARSGFTPIWLVLNWCGSYSAAVWLLEKVTEIRGIAAWRNETDDDRCANFTDNLYREVQLYGFPQAFENARGAMDEHDSVGLELVHRPAEAH